MIRAHLRRWRPRLHAQRTGSTPRVHPSGAALQLDPSHRSRPSMIRAHLRRFIGGGLGGPLRYLHQESVARAKPALGAEHSTLGGPLYEALLASHARGFHFRAPALPAQRFLGGGFGRGAKPPSEWNVQRVRLACGPRAPPCSWTLLIALARAFLRQAPRRRRRRLGPGTQRVCETFGGTIALGRPAGGLFAFPGARRPTAMAALWSS